MKRAENNCKTLLLFPRGGNINKHSSKQNIYFICKEKNARPVSPSELPTYTNKTRKNYFCLKFAEIASHVISFYSNFFPWRPLRHHQKDATQKHAYQYRIIFWQRPSLSERKFITEITSKQCCGTVPFCLGSGSGSQIFHPRFRLRFRFLLLNFKLFSRTKLLPVTLIFVSSLASFMHVSASVPSE